MPDAVEWVDDPDALAREREEMDKIEQMWVESFTAKLPPAFREATLETFDPITPGLMEAHSKCVAWTMDPSTGLFLTGPVGCGKTHLAVACARTVAKSGKTVKYLPVSEYLEDLRASYSGTTECVAPRRWAEAYDLLILDDVGVTRGTDWALDVLYSLLDSAYTEDCVLIATSNLDYKELESEKVLGERSTSRLVALTDKIVVAGEDYRAAQHRARRK